MHITWYGHSAFRVEIEGAAILIDPFLTGNPKFSGSVDTVRKGVTHIVVTHGHDDHVGDAAAIAKATGAQVTGSFEVCSLLAEDGVENINPGNHGGTVDCGPFTVSFVNALHSSGTVRDGRSIYLGNPLGVILKAAGEKTLYHMGDTEIFGDMALINEIHRPRIGIVPIGDRFTMSGRTAALACRRFFDFDAIIPCHYATFPMIDQTADRLLAAMEGDAGKVAVLAPMERRSF